MHRGLVSLCNQANLYHSQLQQYVMRVISGIIIVIMYYQNTAFGAYMPINSNSAFTNTMESYNVSKVLNDEGTGSVNVLEYMSYGPPYYAIANLFVACLGLSKTFY